jgi:hypothetical protein
LKKFNWESGKNDDDFRPSPIRKEFLINIYLFFRLKYKLELFFKNINWFSAKTQRLNTKIFVFRLISGRLEGLKINNFGSIVGDKSGELFLRNQSVGGWKEKRRKREIKTRDKNCFELELDFILILRLDFKFKRFCWIVLLHFG